MDLDPPAVDGSGPMDLALPIPEHEDLLIHVGDGGPKALPLLMPRAQPSHQPVALGPGEGVIERPLPPHPSIGIGQIQRLQIHRGRREGRSCPAPTRLACSGMVLIGMSHLPTPSQELSGSTVPAPREGQPRCKDKAGMRALDSQPGVGQAVARGGLVPPGCSSTAFSATPATGNPHAWRRILSQQLFRSLAPTGVPSAARTGGLLGPAPRQPVGAHAPRNNNARA